jgi:hypothetical protein
MAHNTKNSGTNPAQPQKPVTPPTTQANAALLRTNTLSGPQQPSLPAQLAKRFGPPPGRFIPQAMPPNDPVSNAPRKFQATPHPERPKPTPPP